MLFLVSPNSTPLSSITIRSALSLIANQTASLPLAMRFMGVGVGLANNRQHKRKKSWLGKACKTKVHVPFREARGQKQKERVREGGKVERS